jgi:hypothetical protein
MLQVRGSPAAEKPRTMQKSPAAHKPGFSTTVERADHGGAPDTRRDRRILRVDSRLVLTFKEPASPEQAHHRQSLASPPLRGHRIGRS